MGSSPISFGFSPSLWPVTRPAEMRGLSDDAKPVSPNVPVSDLLGRLLDGGPQDPRREAAVMRLRRMVEYAETQGSRGSYAGWITKLAFEDILQRGSHEELGTILPFFEKGGRLEDYEKAVASILKPKPPVSRSVCAPVFLKILSRRLPISVTSQSVLAQSIDLAWPEAESFLESVRRLQEKPERARQLEEALLLAKKSPLAALRVRWLSFLITQKDPLVRFKLAEMGDPDFRFSGIDGSFLPRSAGTQWDAYLDDPSTSALLAEVERRASSLLAPEGAPSRALSRRRKLMPGTTFPGPREIAAAFRLLGDAYSLKIAQAIESEEFILLPEGDSIFDAHLTEIGRRFQKRMDPKTQNAFYAHSGVLGDKGILFVRIPSSGLSTSDDLFEILAAVVHDFQHHEDGLPERESAPEVFRLELKAHLREFLWRAEHGDVERLRELTSDVSMGLALSFRDYFEVQYGALFEP